MMKTQEDLDIPQIVSAFMVGLGCMPLLLIVLGFLAMIVSAVDFLIATYPLLIIGFGFIALTILLRSKSRQKKTEAACFLIGLALSYAVLWWLFNYPWANAH